MRKRAVWVWLLLVAATPAFGHRLSVDFVRAGDAIKIEVFYPEDGSPAAGARVRVTTGGREVASGDTDAQGAFEFRAAAQGPLEVEARIGEHRATCTIEVAAGAAAPGADAATSIRRAPFPVVQVIAGLGAIFGLFGFVLALRVARRARCIEARVATLEEERRRAS